MDGMQRIDEHGGPAERQACGDAAAAKTGNDVGFGSAGDSGLGQPCRGRGKKRFVHHAIIQVSKVSGGQYYCGVQPAGAISNLANSKPGATVHPTSVQSPNDCAACHACAGTTACGRWPAPRSLPNVMTSRRPFAAISSSSAAPA